MPSHVRTAQRGFTLAELLVAIAIVGLVVAGVFTFLMSGSQIYLTGSNQVDAQTAVRAVLVKLAEELRAAGYDLMGRGPCSAPPPPPACFDAITNASSTEFTIQTDWDGNGAISPGAPVTVSYSFGNVVRGEQITYSIVGGTLRRREIPVDPQPQDLLTNIQQASEGGVLQPFFQYLDANNNVIPTPGATPWDIRTIVVRLRAGAQNQAPAIWQAGAVQVTMSDRIRLRNR